MKIDFTEFLKGKKNLLAFSHGTDSTALFYLLLDECEFDLCMINYHTRASSDDEVLAARELAKHHNKRIFIKNARLRMANFESQARQFRYEYFDEVMSEYDNLIIAHNLNDRFEWLLMQLSKGAGLCNLLGFNGVDTRNDYQIIRPLINVSKDEIMQYLKQNNIKYFQDESNFDIKHTRNKFRKLYANDFIKEFKNGVANSLNYLELDKNELLGTIIEYKGLYICTNANSLDKAIKKLGFISTAKQKQELFSVINNKGEGVLHFKKDICVCKYLGVFVVFIRAFTTLSKASKEEFRKAKIPALLRLFLASNKISLAEFKNTLKYNNLA